MMSSVQWRRLLVLFSGFFANATSVGLMTNLSVLYSEWLLAFQRGKAETAVILAVYNNIFNFTGMFTGIMLTKFEPRIIGIISGMLSVLGYTLSYFATNVTYMALVFGFLSGLGCSGMFLSSALIIKQYFEGKQQHMALSFTVVGTGVGGIVFTYLQNVLVQQYGWRGCMLLIGGILVHNVPLFAVCKPYPKTKVVDIHVERDKLSSNKNAILKQLRKISKNKLLFLNVLGICCTFSSFISTLIIFVDFLEFKGFSRNDAVLLMLIMTITNTCLRLLPGLLKQVRHVSIFAVALLHSSVGSIALFCLPSVHSFTGVSILMCCFGFGIAGTLGSVLIVTTLTTTGNECFSLGLGITLTFAGVCNAISAPITGLFRDVTGSYDASFYFNASLGCCGALCYVLLLYLHTSKNTTSDKERTETVSVNNENDRTQDTQSDDESVSIQPRLQTVGTSC